MSKTRLGIFVVASLGMLAAGVFLIGSNHLTFRSTYRLRAEFENVAGLNIGAEVRVGGLHEGTVAAIDLPKGPGGKMAVVMDMANRTRAVVKKDSVATIQAEGLIGDEYVEVTFGSSGGGEVRPGDTIASQPPLQIAELFDKANGILDQVKDAVGNIEGSTKNLEAISGKIDRGTGTMGALVNDKSLYEKADSGVTALQEDAEALKHNFLLRGFFAKRGYEDASELTKNAIRQLPPESAEKKFAFEAKGLFERPDTAKLKDDKVLKQAGQFLQSNPFGLAVVAGLSGMKGDTSQEDKLTLARAAVVRDYLVKNFRLDDTRVKTIGLGKNPDTPDSGEVEVLVYGKAESRTAGGR